MKNINKKLILLCLCLCMFLSETCLATQTSAASTSAAQTTPAAQPGESFPAAETTSAAESASAEPEFTRTVDVNDGFSAAGVCGLIIGTNILSVADVYKTPGEVDWELRGSAIKKYENLGIAQVDSYLNVRKKPDPDAEVIGKMTNNNACEILSKSSDGKWLKIESGSVTGWVSSDYILTGWRAKDQGRAEAELQVIIKVDTLNVREEPDANSTIWTQADGNERYDIVKDLGDWIMIELDDSVGYVAAEYVEQTYSLNTAVKYTPPAEEVARTLRGRIVAYALKWLGGRYVWGGETLGKGVDCSGFVMKIYQNFGIYLTHHSGTMAGEGRRISRSQLKKGDLVFYAKGGSINHVAMYIGDGQVVHARSRRRGICITDIDYRTPVRFVTYLDE
ncbi:MAG: C40 family peptidase [Lachnospiraceae bacterium]|nr:C40 family peptidase [Lachnospiraceae bacterium]MBR6271697.1 C40 family peptidase [Lachnospiraceae bacterium]